MIAMYSILKSINMLNIWGMALVYVGGSGLGFYVFKGFLDTIPRSIDEAATIDGATRWQTFIHITLPLSRPMIVYTSLMAFIGPWLDFMFSSYILEWWRSQNSYSGLWIAKYDDKFKRFKCYKPLSVYRR